MADRYADLRKATQIRNIFCSPEAIFGYRAAAHPETIRALLADYDRMRDALAEIADYWNRDQNDQAMYDACWHAINTANAALAQEQGGSDG